MKESTIDKLADKLGWPLDPISNSVYVSSKDVFEQYATCHTDGWHLTKAGAWDVVTGVLAHNTPSDNPHRGYEWIAKMVMMAQPILAVEQAVEAWAEEQE